MTRVVVTGAGGFVGGRLALHLAGRADVELRAVVRHPIGWLPRGVEQVTADLCDARATSAALAGADVVVHLAGPNEATRSSAARALCDSTAIAISIGDAVPDAARLVYLSTTHVYGAALAAGAIVDTSTIPEPRHWYGVARLASEHLLAAAATDLVVLRLTNAVGAPAHPGVDRWTLIATDLARQAATGGELVLRTDGMQWRDFVAIADACDAIAAAAGLVPGIVVPSGTYDFGSERPMTVRDLAHLVADVAEDRIGRSLSLRAPEPRRDPPSPARVSSSALASLGVAASRDIRSAITELIDFCIEHRESL